MNKISGNLQSFVMNEDSNSIYAILAASEFVLLYTYVMYPCSHFIQLFHKLNFCRNHIAGFINIFFLERKDIKIISYFLGRK